MAAPHICPDLIDAKRALRERMLAARKHWDPVASGAAVAATVLRACRPPTGVIVSGYWPIADELDIRPLLTALHEGGHPIVLPVTPKRGNPLTFRLWRPGGVLEPERFGTFRPVGEERVPDFLLVPLLAFDRRGYRVGYGAGFYDRTLAGLPRRFALGVAFAAQEVDEVPAGPTDIPLNAVATETDLIICKAP